MEIWQACLLVYTKVASQYMAAPWNQSPAKNSKWLLCRAEQSLSTLDLTFARLNHEAMLWLLALDMQKFSVDSNISVLPKCFRWIQRIQWQKYNFLNKFIWTYNLFCKRPGHYHSANQTEVTKRIFKLIPIHVFIDLTDSLNSLISLNYF